MADKKDALTVEELGLIEAEAAMWGQTGDRCDGNDPCDYDNVCRQHKVTLLLGKSMPLVFERLRAMQTEVESLRSENLELKIKPTRDYLKSPATTTFAELKHSRAGTVLAMLQDGAISRGKACEVLAELAHGVPFDEVLLPEEKGNQFNEDEVPADVVVSLRAEVESLRGDRERLSALEELVCGTPGNVIINYDPELREGWQVIDSATGNRWIGIDLIAAIDAARSASAPEKKRADVD